MSNDYDPSYQSPAQDPTNMGVKGIPMVKVWDPFGKEHIVRKDNANDLVSHGTLVEINGEQVKRKWSMVDPTLLREQVALLNGPAGVEPSAKAVENVKLQALRDVAKSLGIEIDERWGIKRLTEVIGGFKAVPKEGAEA